MTEATKPLRPAKRQEQITEMVLARGSVAAQDLAEHFDVSPMTVYRDLDELQRRGVLRRSRGIATAQPSGVFEASVAYRREANLAAKRAIARQAARHVEPGMSVLLDDSTTALQMVPLLAELAPLQIATNYLEAMRQIATRPDNKLIALGGDYDAQHDAFLGVMCIRNIRSIRVDAMFMSTSAVAGAEAYHQESRIVAVKQAMLEAATKRYLLLDHTKLGKVALHSLAPLSEFDLIIVDSDTPAEALTQLEEQHLRIEVAEP